MRTTDVRVRRAVHAVAEGHPVVVLGGGHHDGGYLAFAADAATPKVLAFTVRHSAGLVRVALPAVECDRLNLPPMWSQDAVASRASAQRVAVDFGGVGTGISATDRAATIAALASPRSCPGDFRRPGHVIPVRAGDAGVVGFAGPEEAAVDLARLAGRRPGAGLCELVSGEEPTGIAAVAEAAEFALAHGLAAVSIADLVSYRRRTEPQVRRVSDTRRPIAGGLQRMIGFRDVSGAEHLVVVIGGAGPGEPIPLHVHVGDLTADFFGAKACGGDLGAALTTMAAAGSGVIVCLRPCESVHASGLLRSAGAGPLEPAADTLAWILRDLGLYPVRLDEAAQGFGLVMFGAIRQTHVAA